MLSLLHYSSYKLSGTNTSVSEEELMIINIDSSEQSRARLQLQPTPRCVGSSSPDPEAAGSASLDPLGAGSVSPDGDLYRRQPLQVQAYGPRSKL